MIECGEKDFLAYSLIILLEYDADSIVAKLSEVRSRTALLFSATPWL